METNRIFTTLSSYLPWIVLIGAIMMATSDIIAISLNTAYNPVSETISELILYPYGWLIAMSIAEVVIKAIRII